MKLLLAVGLIVCASPVVQAQSSLQQNRQAIAAEWLHDLCVVPDGALRNGSVGMLTAAFDAWRKSNESSGNCAFYETSAANPPDPAAHKRLELKDTTMIPTLADRLLRVTEFRLEVQQTPDYVYGIKEGDPAGTQSTFLPNPNHGIVSAGGPLHFDELFVPSDIRIKLCNALGADKQDPNSEIQQAAIRQAHCNDEDYMATGRPRDRIARIGSSVTLDIRFSQVPRFESGVLVSSDSTAGKEKWSPTITGSFDPSKLYRSTAEIEGLGTYISTNSNYRPDRTENRRFNISYLCGKDSLDADGNFKDSDRVRNCIGMFTGGSKLQRTLLSLLPVINVKVTTPFDLAKYGSTFAVPPDHSGRSLYYASFNWNLQKLIPSASVRASAIKSLDAVYNPQPKKPAEAQDAEWKRKVKALYVELKMTPEVCTDDQWWANFRLTVLHLDNKVSPTTTTPVDKPVQYQSF